MGLSTDGEDRDGRGKPPASDPGAQPIADLQELLARRDSPLSIAECVAAIRPLFLTCLTVCQATDELKQQANHNLLELFSTFPKYTKRHKREKVTAYSPTLPEAEAQLNADFTRLVLGNAAKKFNEIIRIRRRGGSYMPADSRFIQGVMQDILTDTCIDQIGTPIEFGVHLAPGARVVQGGPAGLGKKARGTK